MNGPPLEKSDRKIRPDIARAVEELKAAADEDQDPDAMFLLAEMSFYGNFTYPRDFGEAFQWYSDLAWLNGNHTAQYMVGFMYATGIGGAVEPDQAKALLYHEFAAEAGNTRSEMTLAYRYHTGIGTPKDCGHAIVYYKKVADKAIDYYRSGPPGGHAMIRNSYRWADEEGGVYGEGASVSSSGHNARDAAHSSTDASVEDVLEYLDLLSRKGELKATFTLGKMNYEGARGLPRNFRRAMKYFKVVAKRYWNKDGAINPNHPAGLDKLAAKAAGHIGVMYLRGEGVEQSYGTALTWFRRGVVNGDALCQHEMGLMYLHGYGVSPDAYKASSYFKAASEQDLPASETRLGALFLDQGDVATAARYFDLAARWGWMEAYYYLAEMANFGVGRQQHCGVAAAYYKMVAEKAEVIHSSIAESNAAFEAGDKEGALIPAMMAAEQGYEHAQANVAYILDEQRSLLSLNSLLPWARKARSGLLRNAALALIYWTRSAKQANIDSLVKMGDYYLSGIGAILDADKASTCYHNAAEAHHSAQAYWNLGWMHENGVAVAQDFYMAKRYYDLALETNTEAYLPVKLSLLKLRIRGYWNRITNGNINPIREEQGTTLTMNLVMFGRTLKHSTESKPRRTFREWITAFIENDEEGYYDEMHERRGGEEDEFTGSRGLESEEHRDDGYYDDLEFDIDEGMLEGLLIVGLAATLLVLVYIRQQQQQRNRQNENANAEGNGNDRGFFPRPGDPGFGPWVAASVVASTQPRRSPNHSSPRCAGPQPPIPHRPPTQPKHHPKSQTRARFLHQPAQGLHHPPNLPLSATRARKPARTSTFSPRSPLADPEILVLQKQQRALQSRIAALRSEVDNARQALRIESSTRDAELEALIIKWRVVSQDAADEVFVGARERVARMGGMATWRERAKHDTFQWDDEMGNQGNAGEETDYPKFTMEFMLKTLNIEPVTIGFDTAAQKWSRD
ncbi:Tetratricopeptide-like helical [Penicillium alfredii]|uniref:Tetratricopeptide-like helical n=1 Tax=Penicillium alfredii TaxID=1506179 RepID=A0A9W9F0K4_9EURO|nr:Tetratricopeptide-like helical [Penicillium alfredii]KAJ5091359.1 Tetratricopeptide-like helical [Penicillium alfredii]